MVKTDRESSLHGKLSFSSLFAIILILQCPSGSYAEQSATNKLVFLGNYNIAPVVYLENGAAAGVAVDIVRALAKHIAQPIEIRAMDWKEAQGLVARGEADALIQINQTEERKKTFDFSDPLLESHFSIFTRTDRVDIPGLSSLQYLRVGVEPGGLPQILLSRMPLVQLTVIPNFLEGFKLLSGGSIDAVVVDYRVGSYAIAENGFRNIKATGEPIESSYSAFAVKKGNTQLLDAINKALRIIKADGTYQKIIDRWKPKEVVFYTREQIERMVVAGASILFLATLLVAVIWIVSLRRELLKRKSAEKKIREQHDTLHGIIDSVNALVFSVDRQYRYTSFNAGHAAVMKAIYGAEIELGRSLLDYMTVELDRDTAKRNLDRALAGEWLVEEAFSGEERLSRQYFQVSHSPILGGKEEVIGAAILSYEMTDRKRAEDTLFRTNRELRAISKCNQALMRVEDEQELLDDICHIICDEAGYRMAWVGYAENDENKTVRPVSWAGVEDGYLSRSNITWADTERGRGPTGTAVRIGQSCYIQDFSTDPRIAPWREAAMQRGYHSSIALPLMGDTLPAFAVLTVYSAESDAFTQGEIQLLKELAGDMAFGMVVLHGRSARMQAEEKLRLSEVKYRTLFEESLDGIFITSPAGKILDINKQGILLLGYTSLEEVRSLDLERDVYANPPDRKRVLAMVDERGTAEYEFGAKKKGGELFTAYCASTAVKDERGDIAYYRGIIRDITEMKRAEERLRESEDRYRRITEGLTDYLYSVRIEKGKAVQTMQTPASTAVTGFAPEEFDGDPYLWIQMVAPEDRELVQERVRQILAGKEVTPIEHRIIRKDGAIRWVCDTTIPKKDTFGNLLSYDGVIKDITERKEAEQELQKNLLEKEVLLQEVHHRVKNNLNVISSLLSLQSSFIQTPEEAIKAFQYSRDRIMAMAFVHQELYQSKDYSRIDIGTYLIPLTKQLAGLYCSDSSIRVITDINTITLDVGFAVPIGLIVNELITNAFKHAFPGGGPGEILISFRQDGPDFYEFSVSDNGKGMSGCDEEPKMGSLGLTLVRLLVQQIDGISSISCDNGTSFSIRFPLKARIE